MDSLNDKDRLPRFLIITLDKDILNDFKNFDTEKEVAADIALVSNYLTRQVDIAVHRKKCQISAAKLGALGCESDLTVIYIDMIERLNIAFTGSSKMNTLINFRYMFNYLLHKAIKLQEQRVMSIRSCRSINHFDAAGNL